MKQAVKIELKLEDFEKCFLLVDSECPLGQLYDFSCALKHFVHQRIQDAEKQEKEKTEDEQKAV